MNFDIIENTDEQRSMIKKDPELKVVTITTKPSQNQYYDNLNFNARLNHNIFILSGTQFLLEGGDRFFTKVTENGNQVKAKLKTANGDVYYTFGKDKIGLESPYSSFCNQLLDLDLRNQFNADRKEMLNQMGRLITQLNACGLPYVMPDGGEYIKAFAEAKGNIMKIRELAYSFANALHTSVKQNLECVKKYGKAYGIEYTDLQTSLEKGRETNK